MPNYEVLWVNEDGDDLSETIFAFDRRDAEKQIYDKYPDCTEVLEVREE